MAKKGDKKGEGDDNKEIKEILQYEIELLENLIFQEQDKENCALEQLDKIVNKHKEYTLDINKISLDEGKKSNLENNNIESITNSFILQEASLKKEITDLEEEIREKRVEISDLKRKNLEELRGKDESTAQQKKQLIDTAESFRAFLLKACKKFQDGFTVNK